MMQQLRQKWLCFYSIIRYVPHPLRDEARNIGVIVLCSEHRFCGMRYRLERAGLSTNSVKYQFLQKVMGEYRDSLPGYYRGQEPFSWTRERLESMHQEYTNVIQFSAPIPALGDPITLLDDLQHEFVMPVRGTAIERRTRAVAQAVDVLQRALAPQGKDKWVRIEPKVEVHGLPYHFDVAVQNGHLYYTIDLLAFRAQDLQRVEARGAWYARVWRDVAQETGANGIVLIEGPQKAGLLQDRCNDVAEWIREAGVRVARPQDVEEVGREIATSLN